MIIFLTMNPDPLVANEALRLGASGYLLKKSETGELLLAVHNVVRGITYVTRQIRQAIEEMFIRDPRSLSQPQELTARQREVLQMLAEGRSMKEIAFVLQITHRTVRFHKALASWKSWESRLIPSWCGRDEARNHFVDTTAPADDQWHIAFAPYLWFAGMHGYVGVFDRNVGVKASPGDLLSHADIGLMGTLEARKENWVIPVDIMWLALSDDKELPENEPGIESITFRAG